MPPLLSVVVGLTSGRRGDVRRCVTSLRAQTYSPIEIVVPYDDPCAAVAILADEFPGVRFLATGLDTSAARVAGTREHHDVLRTIGLHAASGAVIALVEDHARASPSWATALMDALERHPGAAAVGGAVDCDSAGALDYAVWLCDFGRYQSPLREEPTRFLSDTNVAYRREALERVSASWTPCYHEPAVHAALIGAGFELWAVPRAVTWQSRGVPTPRAALRERYRWGRSFAGTRARAIGRTRWLLALLTPVLPFVLVRRAVTISVVRGTNRRRLARSLLALLWLETAWAAGELVGYITSAPE